MYDLVIINGSTAGLSVACVCRSAGIDGVKIIEQSNAVAFPDLVGPNQLDVSFGESVERVETDDGSLQVRTNRMTYATRNVLVATQLPTEEWTPSIDYPDSARIVIDQLEKPTDSDILIVGNDDHAVQLTDRYANEGNRVVLAAGGMNPNRLSPLSEDRLKALERKRKATLLYRSAPTSIELYGGYPMVFFGDRRTPDLQFDYVVFTSPRLGSPGEDANVSAEAKATGNVWFVEGSTDGADSDSPSDTTPSAPSWTIDKKLLEGAFSNVELPASVLEPRQRARNTGVVEELRDEHYNATITHFEPTHSDLWVLRVKPDHGNTSYLPGQYASLGLGFWEGRIDDAEDPEAEKRWDKLIRRSYSISSRIFDENGYLIDENGLDELEFYIVLVRPTEDNTPALTPRLALKHPGDRIYLGPKVAGRYTLKAVENPQATIVFFGTGTGEAPHNGMAVELLRKGHTGPIVSAVSVRYSADLGYLKQQEQLTSRYPNYHYFPMPTREDGVEKRYLQDLLRDGDFEQKLGVNLSPDKTHVFLCGNPAMIGLPEDDNGQEAFPKPEGVVEILTRKGFTLDRRNEPGNIHYEEYW